MKNLKEAVDIVLENLQIHYILLKNQIHDCKNQHINFFVIASVIEKLSSSQHHSEAIYQRSNQYFQTMSKYYNFIR